MVGSRYCRAAGTAEPAFGLHRKAAAPNFEPAVDHTEARTAAMRDRVAPLLGARPPAGRDTVLVGHDDPFEAATGVYPRPMAVARVIRPDANNGIALLGGIAPGDWAGPR